MEGSDANAICDSANNLLLSVTETWLNPSGLVASEASFNVLRFQSITRNQAGTYVCILAANTGDTALAALPVVVECESYDCRFFPSKD